MTQPEVKGTVMSGSGATVFAMLRSKDDAEALRERVLEEFGANLWLCACETAGWRGTADSGGGRAMQRHGSAIR